MAAFARRGAPASNAAMAEAFSPRAKRTRWMKIRRDQESWLFATTFILILIAGLIAFAVFDGLAVSAEVNGALAFAAAVLALLAPPPVRRLVWHALANHIGVAPPRLMSAPRVIDGDTIEDASGVRYRLANIDAPETGDNARCDSERERGEIAKHVATRLVRAAQRVEVRQTFRIDRYGRRVAFVFVDGVDLGQFLMRRGLARPWRGQRRTWCGRMGGLAKIARTGAMAHECNACSRWRD